MPESHLRSPQDEPIVWGWGGVQQRLLELCGRGGAHGEP